MCVSTTFATLGGQLVPKLDQPGLLLQPGQGPPGTLELGQRVSQPLHCNSFITDFSDCGQLSSSRNSVHSDAESYDVTKQSSISQRAYTPASGKGKPSLNKKEFNKNQVRRSFSENCQKSSSVLQHKASIRLMKKKKLQKTLSTEEGSSVTSISPAKTRKQSSIKRVIDKIKGAHRKLSIPSEDFVKSQSDFLEQFDSIPDNRIVENWLLSIDDDDTSQVESESVQQDGDNEDNEDNAGGDTTPVNIDVTQYVNYHESFGTVKLEMDVGAIAVGSSEASGTDDRYEADSVKANIDISYESSQPTQQREVQEDDQDYDAGDITPVNMDVSEYINFDKQTGKEVQLEIDLGSMTHSASEAACSDVREKGSSINSSSDGNDQVTEVNNLQLSRYMRQVSNDSKRSGDTHTGENAEITAFNTKHNSNPRFTCEGDSIRTNPAGYFKPISQTPTSSLSSLHSDCLEMHVQPAASPSSDGGTRKQTLMSRTRHLTL